MCLLHVQKKYTEEVSAEGASFAYIQCSKLTKPYTFNYSAVQINCIKSRIMYIFIILYILKIVYIILFTVY